MEYDELELEKKRKTLKNYWSFAFAKACIEQEKEIDENLRQAYENLAEPLREMFRPEDVDETKAQQAAEILKAAEEVHESIKANENKKEEVRKDLDDSGKKLSMDEYAKLIKDGILDYCKTFTTEQDKNVIAQKGLCLLQYTDAMYLNPKLAAKVDLTSAQMSVAMKIINMGSLIHEGMMALETELVDSANIEHKLTPEEHKSNLAKIACMDSINNQRFSGNMLKELVNSKLLDDTAKKKPLELGKVLADDEERRRMSISLLNKAAHKESPTVTK